MGITLSSVGGNRSEKEKQRAGEIVKPRLVTKGHDDSGRGCCRHGHARYGTTTGFHIIGFFVIAEPRSPVLLPLLCHQPFPIRCKDFSPHQIRPSPLLTPGMAKHRPSHFQEVPQATELKRSRTSRLPPPLSTSSPRTAAHTGTVAPR